MCFNRLSENNANDAESPAAVAFVQAEAPATDIPHF